MKKKIKKFNPFILSKIGRHFDHGMSWIRTSAVVEHPPREIYWNPMVGSQSKMNSNIGLGFGFFSESTVVAQITYLEGTDSFSEILKARLFFFLKYMLDIMLQMLKSVSEVLTVISRKAIGYEFPLPLPRNGNVSLWWPLPPKPLFQLLICLLLLGAFSPIPVAPTVFKAVAVQPSLQAEEPGSVGKPLLANLNELIQTKNTGRQKELGDPYCSPIPHQGRKKGILCPEAHAKRDRDEKIS